MQPVTAHVDEDARRCELTGMASGAEALVESAGGQQRNQNTENGHTVLTDLNLDQAALRALLDQLWDAHSEVRLVTTIDDEVPREHR